MILATHTLVGAAIGEKIGSPWLIVFLSLAMHFILDAFRHGEYVESFNNNVTFKNTWWKVALDFFIGFLAVLLLIYFNQFSALQIKCIFIGVFASIFPDSLTFLYWKFNFPLLKKLYEFHSWCHKYPHSAPARAWTLHNATNDIVISVTAIIILFMK